MMWPEDYIPASYIVERVASEPHGLELGIRLETCGWLVTSFNAFKLPSKVHIVIYRSRLCSAVHGPASTLDVLACLYPIRLDLAPIRFCANLDTYRPGFFDWLRLPEYESSSRIVAMIHGGRGHDHFSLDFFLRDYR